MTREELIEAMAVAVCTDPFIEETNPAKVRQGIVFILSAIEASGHAIVPVEATEAMLEAAWGAMFEEPYDCTSDHMIGNYIPV